MRWAIGAVAAVLGAMAILPGVASAGHFEYAQDIECDDGTFEARITYDAGGTSLNVIITIDVEGVRYAGDATTGGVQTTRDPGVQDAPASWGSDNNYSTNPPGNSFTFSDQRDRFEVDGHGGAADETDHFESFLVISGSYDDVDAAPDDSIDIEGNIYIHNPGFFNDSLLDNDPNEQLDANQEEDGSTLERSITLDDFQSCLTELCVDGELSDVLEFQGEDTGDCGQVIVCLGDNTAVVSEHEQNEGNLPEGECGPLPPPSPPTVTTPPPVQQVAAAVSEVLPARLPSTGTGPSDDSTGVSMVAVLAVALLSIGGLATLIARRSGS